MKHLCIYRRGCIDGFTAAWAMWKRHGDRVEFLAVETPRQAPLDVRGRDVIILGLTYRYGILRRLLVECDTLTLFDRERINAEDLSLVEIDFRSKATFVIERDHSAALIAWRHFHPGAPAPELVWYAQDIGLLRYRYPHSVEVEAALRSHPQEFAVWERLKVSDLKADGTAILRHRHATAGGEQQHA